MKIALFGDSISTHIEMEVMTQTLLAEAGIAARVERFAVAGEDTNAAMNRLAGVVASRADYYYIFFGANDAAVHRHISPSQFADNLTTFVTAFGAGKTTILTPSYVNETAIANTQKMLGRTNKGFVPYVDIAKQVASQTGSGLIELNQAMLASPNPDDLIVSDGVHFTTKGYQLITSLIATDVRNRELKKDHV